MLPPQSPSMPFGFSMCGALASYPLFFDFSLVFGLLYFSIRSVLCLLYIYPVMIFFVLCFGH